MIKLYSLEFKGGPLENIIAAKAVCFKEALQPEFKEYIKQVIHNCKALAEDLKHFDFNVLTGGTDNHLILLDLRNKNITGKELENRLEQVGLTTNKNAVPFDTQNKSVTSGIRLGTAAVTSRGLKEAEMRTIAMIINNCCSDDYQLELDKMRSWVSNICKKYPLYQD